jgi:hypothetical protein
MNDPAAYPTPFESPLYSLPSLHVGNLFIILFFLVFVAWAVYTIIAAYHWFRYGHRSWLAIPAIVTHVVVSGALILYIASGV